MRVNDNDEMIAHDMWHQYCSDTDIMWRYQTGEYVYCDKSTLSYNEYDYFNDWLKFNEQECR